MIGSLIVIEGIDGAGTTTQSRKLVSHLNDIGHPTHLTREPSTGPIGHLLREILEGRHKPINQTTLGLLFAADRADHLCREVEPALAEGKIVVSDRWYHSSLAYQGTEEDRRWIWELNQRARRPDITLFLNVPPETAASRRKSAQRTDEIFDAIATQKRVAQGYRDAFSMLGDSERILEIDGCRSENDVAASIFAAIESFELYGGPSPADS